jgi:RNA polymerase sigma-70 factor (ECF subfamily)
VAFDAGSANGSGKLMTDFVSRHSERLLAMIDRRLDRRLRARIDAQEVLDDVFLRAIDRQVPADPPDIQYARLYRMALDELSAQWRHHRQKLRDLTLDVAWPADSAVEFALGLVAPGTSPSNASERKLVCDQVRRVLAELAGRDREVLEMRGLDEISFGQIGVVLGISENHAAKCYARAAERFAQAWRRLFGEPEIK